MPISETTIKRLFAKCKNRCAMPECRAHLVIGETIVAEICHIRARRKGGARYDPTLSEEQKNESANLILLCPTCHKLADKDKTGAYPVGDLLEIKAEHERDATFELSPAEVRHALAILAKHNAKGKRVVKHSTVSGEATSNAGRGGVAFSFVGNNVGDIKIHMPTGKRDSGNKYPANSIGADANLSGYVDYLCALYVDYMRPTGKDEDTLRAMIGTAIKRKFRLRQRTRYHIPAERFSDVVTFAFGKLRATPVGKKHTRNGTKLCSTFTEWRTTTR